MQLFFVSPNFKNYLLKQKDGLRSLRKKLKWNCNDSIQEKFEKGEKLTVTLCLVHYSADRKGIITTDECHTVFAAILGQTKKDGRKIDRFCKWRGKKHAKMKCRNTQKHAKTEKHEVVRELDFFR